MSFDISDPASVAGAIQSMEALVDERLPLRRRNAVNGPLRNDLKEKYRRRFLSGRRRPRAEGMAGRRKGG